MRYYNVKIRRAIEKCILEGKRKFIIYPFGEQGMILKNVMINQYGIKEIIVIDNHLSQYSTDGGIKDLSILKKININDYAILVASDSVTTYSEIRKALLEYIDVKDYIDVLSPSLYWDDKAYYDDPWFEFPRLTALEMAAREIYRNNVRGKIAECGVYQGWFANYMSQFFPEREFFLFDTFEGFDKRDIDEVEEVDSKSFREKENLSDTSVELALNNIAISKYCIVKKGYFPETAKGLESELFAFVSLDTDLYKPIYEGLRFFYPRLAPGGYIFVDDLGHGELLGVRKAVKDYCNENNIGYVPIYDGTDSTAIITKPLE